MPFTHPRLVRIVHRRCDDYDCVTFVLAPPDWDTARIGTELGEAQAAYLVAFEKARKDDPGPPTVGYHPDYEKYPDLTVREVQKAHAAAKAERKAWDEEQKDTRQHFATFLHQRGFLSIWDTDSGVLKVDADWGHRHGQRLDYWEDDKLLDALLKPVVAAGIEDEDEDPFG